MGLWGLGRNFLVLKKQNKQTKTRSRLCQGEIVFDVCVCVCARARACVSSEFKQCPLLPPYFSFKAADIKECIFLSLLTIGLLVLM